MLKITYSYFRKKYGLCYLVSIVKQESRVPSFGSNIQAISVLSFADQVTKIRLVWNTALGTIEKPVLKKDGSLLMTLSQLGNNLEVFMEVKQNISQHTIGYLKWRNRGIFLSVI